MKTKISLFIFFIVSVYMSAQDPGLDYKISSRQLSPQAYEFARYGNIPAKHFVGEVDFSVPLYTYKDRDFTIPITLQYNGNGFMPNKNEGMIGLDWSLNVGGAITRSVHGVPDEGGDLNVLGVLSASKSNVYNYTVPFNTKIQSSSILDIVNAAAPYIAHRNTTTSNNNYGELSPDDFSFYMPGHSGKFNIGWDGKAQVAGNKPYQIIFSDYFHSTSASDRYITIITLDGYQYIFGGQNEAEETSTYFPDQSNLANQKTIRTAWFLRKIVAPNKREVEFIYKSVAPPDMGNEYTPLYRSGHQSLIFKKSFKSTTVGSPQIEKTSLIVSSFLSLENEEYLTYELIRQSSLDKIIIDKKTVIEFSYKEKEKMFYTDAEIPQSLYRNFNKKNLQMTNIAINYNNVLLKNISFKQEYLGTSDASRLFLTGLTSGEEKYSFDYYNLDKIPRPYLQGIDHWGYYNGKPYLIPEMKITMDGMNIIIDSDKQRAANEELSKVGMLRRVLYPTGGGSIFYYGLHLWDYQVRRGYSTLEEVSNSFPGQPFSHEVGGSRINKIEDFDDNGNIVNVREFTYNKGVLLYYPNYLRKITTGINGSNYVNADFYTNAMGSNVFPSEKCIQYAEVIEKNSNNGSIVYRFTSYLDPENRDQFNITPTSYQKVLIDSYATWPPILDFKGDDRSYRRGLPIEKAYYDNESKVVYKEETKYAIQSSSEQNYIMALNRGNFLTSKYRIENYAYLPVETKHYDYRNGIPVISTLQTEYNEKYLVKKETDVENVLVTEYKYPHDLRTTSPYGDMVNLNMLTPVLEKKVSKAGAMLYEHTIKYSGNNFNGNILYLPSATYSKNRGEAAGTLHTIFNNYDAYGNPVAVTGKDNISNVYLWGYRGVYPVAEIRNATYAQVRSALNNTLPESLSSTEIPNIALIESLRDHSSLKDAHITTYTNKPFVGMLTVTAPDKIITYFEYDNYNRLSAIKNHSQEKLSSYLYNLTPTIPIDIKMNVNATYSLRYPVNFVVEAGGGSGQFKYSWYIKDNSGNVLSSLLDATSTSFSYKFSNPVKAHITCIITDIQTGKYREFTKPFEVIIPPVSNISLTYNDLYVMHTTNTYNVYIDGGSGEFTYDWYIKNTSNQSIVAQQLNSSSDTFSATLTQKGTMNLICKVKDLKSGLSIEKTVSFTVKPMVLTLYTGYSFNISEKSNMSVDITGGSGSYQYNWKMTEVATNIMLSQSADARFVTTYTKLGDMKISCTVKDIVRGDTEEISKTIKVVPLPIQFTNIITSNNSSSTKVITADIDCYEATNLRFTIGFGGSSGSASYKIGSSSYSKSSNGSETVNIALPKGKSTVELRLNKSSMGSVSAWITIDAVNSGNNTIGIDRVLNMNM